ncbi:GLPGLI family protein [Mucilaginibacter pineti]|uniref:GLPGLI family protein n=1 Tax=Mucilaginibacter pineti TaxID=1391627 RepID=A0A1G7D930_9SPHI|nr:GLPGLI family protein [Mucilaginibacter pineti]SDE48023.1 GLPGLI family protein [Mucilaginibacter pineti]
MKHILIFIICFFVLSGNMLFAQNKHFTTTGTIEFEKSINMFALLKKEMSGNDDGFMQSAYDSYKKTQPQFKKLKSTLAFGDNKTLYTPIEPEASRGSFFSTPMAEQTNTIFTDLATGTSACQKKVFEEVFLVKDSTRKINWKITSETREIAGFTCRRANAVILDSIYVVAFYTDDIAVSGGPESFTGLPGMILGAAIPHENISWFATKVNEIAVDEKTLVPPKKGKVVNNKELSKTLLSALKDWGTYAQLSLKAFSL